MPNLLVYDGAAIHERISQKCPVSVQYLVDQLCLYLDQFAQAPPYHVVASSMGCKIALELAVQRPQLVARMVLLCPSGLGDLERLPIVEGVRRRDSRALVASVFHDPRHVEAGLIRYYEKRLANRRWRQGLVHTIRGTMEHSVRPLLPHVTQPTLIISGSEDRIVSPAHAEAAAEELLDGHFLSIPCCGHAPQIEKAHLVNRLAVRFLTTGIKYEIHSGRDGHAPDRQSSVSALRRPPDKIAQRARGSCAARENAFEVGATGADDSLRPGP
jgi:pimeloyl-ACP methyl ester carboxylesterase